MGSPTDNTNAARINPSRQEFVYTNDDYIGYAVADSMNSEVLPPPLLAFSILGLS